jgi:hypothetical protein
MTTPRTYRAGQSLEDYCRACKTDRLHTVMAADANGQPIRVVCGYCGSEHNYRGGPRVESGGERRAPTPAERAPAGRPPTAAETGNHGADIPTPSAEFGKQTMETRNPATEARTNAGDLEAVLRRIIREEAGLTPVAPAERWRGGTLVLRPGKPGLQEKVWPIETFFHKVVMLRNRLRTLEQQVNASGLPEDVKIRLQGYITGCYGSLTSFNLLFADDADQFKGTESD